MISQVNAIRICLGKKLTLNIRKWIFVMLFVTPCFHGFTIMNIIFPIKLSHILTLGSFVLLFIHQTKIRIGTLFWMITSFLCIQTCLAYSVYGFNILVINMILCILRVLVGFYISDKFSLSDWLWIGKVSAGVVFVFVLFNLFVQREIFWNYLLNPSYRIGVKTIFQGGLNADESWLGLYTFLSVGGSLWMPMISLVFVFSILTSSRSGILIGLAFLVWIFAQWIRKKMKRTCHVSFWKDWTKGEKMISITLTIVIIGVFVLAQLLALEKQKDNKFDITNPTTEVVSPETSLNKLADRFENIGKESGSYGRLNMWKWVPKEFGENIWGYGLGNGIEKIRENDPGTIVEGNIHNIYFQVLLEQGIIGLLIFFVILFFFIKREIYTLFCNPLAAFLLCYLGAGMIQFRFLDNIFWLIVGAYLNLAFSNTTKSINQ